MASNSNQLIQTKQKLAEEKEEMERQLTEAMEEKIQDMKVEVKSIGESLEAMEDKIQDMKVEGIENIRYIHLHILELLKKNFVDIIVRLTPVEYFPVNLTEKIYQFQKRNLQTNYLKK